MKKVLVNLLLASVAASFAIAAEVKLPIKSQAQLRVHALGVVTRGFRQVESESLVPLPDEPTWVEARGNGAEEVLNKLLATRISFGMVNTDDKVQGRIWLYDSEDNLIFYGYSEYIPGMKQVPAYNIWMQSIPFLEDVVSAEVLVLNEDGMTTRHEGLYVQNGHVYLPPGMSGAKNGILSVRYKDGSVSVFELWDPVSKELDGVSEKGSSWQISGHHVIPPSSADKLVVSFVEAWEQPSVSIDVKSGQSIEFNVLGMVTIDGRNMFERPIGFSFEQIDGSWNGAGVLSETGPSVTKLPAAGKYRIWFDWKNFGQQNMIYAGPVDGGRG